MCGIAGIYAPDPQGTEAGLVREMCGAMSHRGPDDTGFYLDQGMCMGMRRLSIIDVAGGHQPLHNEDASLALVFNGEIYNYVELREELAGRGHCFRTKSDGEPILHLYEEKGAAALDDLNGMFALCLWDRRRRRGFLARDRLGIKPLYYWTDGTRCAFASELKALLPGLPSVRVDSAAVEAYLRYMYVPAPLSPVQGVRKLLPASLLEFSDEGVGQPKEFWALTHPPDGGRHGPQGREEFLRLMDDAVRLQLRSDVPVGIFLSGGIDSSLVTALSTRRLGPKVSSFTVEYEGNPVNEVRPAAVVARLFGCEHHIVRVTTRDTIALLPKLVWHMDEPHADSAMIGTYMVAKAASSYVKVVLNGTGGDELFGGYPWYVGNSRRTRLLHHIPRTLRLTCSRLLRSLGQERGYFQRVAEHRDRLTTFLVSHQQFNYKELVGFIVGKSRDWEPAPSLEDLIASAPGDLVNRMLFTDVKSYLVDDLLLLLDKMTMAVSIEGRVPFLDHRVVEWAFAIPGSEKLPGVNLKDLLKRWLVGVLPDEILSRPKWGFGAPLSHWMNERLSTLTFEILNGRPRERAHLYWGLLGSDLVARLRGLSPQKRFALLALEVWFRVFVDGWSNGVSLEDLAAG